MESKAVLVHEEERNRRRGWLLSLLVHCCLLLLLILPLIHYPIPEPGQEGIQVSLGMPDEGAGDDAPAPQETPKVVNETPKPVVPSPPQPQPVKSPVVEKKVLTTENPEEVAIRKAKDAEKKRQQDEALAKQRAEETARRQAEENARKKAEEEAKKKAEYEQTKNKYGSLLSGNGSGRGDTGKSGNQGDPNGDPNSNNLKGVSTGSGMVGGGLGNRGVKYEPTINDNSQKTGKIVVNVCVNKAGKVISAEYTQKGSTTTDSDLRELAERSAWKFIFEAGDVEKQCGTITVDFKVK